MRAHAIVAIVTAALVASSAVLKLRGDARVVKVVHQVVRVPMRWFPWLAACEIAAAVGLVAGLAWRPVGMAAAIGLVAYFIGAIVAHVRVGDLKGIGPASFLLVLAVAVIVTRMLGV